MAKADPSRRPEPLASNIERLLAEHNERVEQRDRISVRSLALKAGINEWGVRDILAGKSQNPQHSTIEKIARAGGWTVEQLTDEPKPKLSDVHAQLLAEIADLTVDEVRATIAYIHSLRATRAA